jgi:Uma2 family endonuclease
VATAPVSLMTFAEFEQLPEPQSFHYELHHGELVKVAPPKQEHFLIQRELRRRLEAAAGDTGVVDTEIGFRALPEQEYRVADVAFVSMARWEEIPRNGNLLGAPELVIEVLSPSNTVTEIFDKEQLCLEHGCIEFWVVDPIRSQVKVSTRDGHTLTYRQGQQIPLLFGGTLPVEVIFTNSGRA